MRYSLFIALIMTVLYPWPASAQTLNNDVVWVWNNNCEKSIMIRLEVRLDGKVIYSNSLPICKGRRDFENGKASFNFTPNRPIVWYGYRSEPDNGGTDPGDTTPAGTNLKFVFWQAGGEKNTIDLGYGVIAKDGIHMHSMHFLSPVSKITTIMAPGLILETWPEK